MPTSSIPAGKSSSPYSMIGLLATGISCLTMER